jgi:hypothetical protein
MPSPTPKSVDGASSGSNPFERHPRLTLGAVLAVLLVILLGMFELGLRLGHERLGLTISDEHGNPRVLRLREWPPGMIKTFSPPEGRVANDPIGPVEHVYELRIDEAGFIMPSIVHDDPDFEIAFVGGSTTECLYIRPRMRFPYLVGRMLEMRSGLKINSLNAGKSGNHSMHAVFDYLAKVAPRRPRFVVLMEAANDIGTLNREKTYWNEGKSISLTQYERMLRGRQPIAEFLERVREITIPYTYRLVRRSLALVDTKSARSRSLSPAPLRVATSNKPATTAAPNDNEVRRRELLRNSFEPALRSFVRLAKAWGSEPVLMTQVRVDSTADGNNGAADFLSPEALRQGNFDRASFGSIHDYANAVIRHVALTEGAILIDLVSARHWTREDVYDGLHFTETGSRHVAETIEQALSPHIHSMARTTSSHSEPH